MTCPARAQSTSGRAYRRAARRSPRTVPGLGTVPAALVCGWLALSGPGAAGPLEAPAPAAGGAAPAGVAPSGMPLRRPAGPDAAPAAVGWFGPGPAPGPRRSGCTAVLVAPDRVLTATHCLSRDERSAPRDPSRFVFAPGWPWNGPGALFGAAEVTLPEARTLLGGALPFDVALVRLARPVPPQVAEPLPLTGSGGDDTAPSVLTAVAYPNGAPGSALAERACRIVLEEGDVIGIDCAAKPGFSGGAVLAGSAGGWRLRAVIVAQSRSSPPAGAAGAVATYAVRPAGNLRRALTKP